MMPRFFLWDLAGLNRMKCAVFHIIACFYSIILSNTFTPGFLTK